MECNWCERETDNEMVLELNGYGIEVWNVYCDECQKAWEKADKGQDYEM
jgi:hypothetical protein